ncbi:putative holin-like toxin [Paenibacillus xylanexedens]
MLMLTFGLLIVAILSNTHK